MARQSLSRLAQSSFESKGPGKVRFDAVEYCLAALQEFDKHSPGEVKDIVFELTLLGRGGLDTNSPEKKYTLKRLPGKFSGLELVCMMYVGLQQVAPGTDIGFDLSREYEVAKGMFSGN